MRLYDIRKGVAYAVRKALLDRDAGMCAGCGVVCELMEQRRPTEPLHHPTLRVGYCTVSCALRVPCGAPYHEAVTVEPWEAHHVVPVSEGGGGCDLGGYVILCRACHGKETGKLRKRLNGTPVQTQMEL